jgi:protein-tyrosine phosphatase
MERLETFWPPRSTYKKNVRTELHTHLLPGVDDGPTDDAEALELARLAVADGTGTVVATPHVSTVRIETLPDRVERLASALRRAGIPLEVLPGGELSPDDVARAEEAELEAIAQGPPDARWLLLEAPLWFGQPGLSAAAEELRARGFDVLIGHPERSPTFSLDELRRHVRRGSVIQVNASSLTGGHGARARQLGLEVVTSGLPFVLASDAHSPERPPLLSEGACELSAAGLDPRAIRTAVDTGPAQLLEEGLGSLASPDVQIGRSAA